MLVHLSVGLGFTSIRCQTSWLKVAWEGKRICPAARHWLLITAFSPETLHAHSPTSPLPSPSFPTPSLLMHSERQRWQQRCLSRIKDCNELILFSLQLPNCPGFLATAAAVCSRTHTHTRTHTQTLYTHTHSTLLSSLYIFTHVSELSYITLGHFLAFGCFCCFSFRSVFDFIFQSYFGARALGIIWPKCFSCGDVSWQFPAQTGVCVLLGRPKPGSPPTALLKIVDERSSFLILDTYLLLMEEGVPCPAPAAKLTPPVRKSQDMRDERSKLVNEYACRVLELLGMGHRLFVPRLLAVRLLFIELHLSGICPPLWEFLVSWKSLPSPVFFPFSPPQLRRKCRVASTLGLYPSLVLATP